MSLYTHVLTWNSHFMCALVSLVDKRRHSARHYISGMSGISGVGAPFFLIRGGQTPSRSFCVGTARLGRSRAGSTESEAAWWNPNRRDGKRVCLIKTEPARPKPKRPDRNRVGSSGSQSAPPKRNRRGRSGTKTETARSTANRLRCPILQRLKFSLKRGPSQTLTHRATVPLREYERPVSFHVPWQDFPSRTPMAEAVTA